MVLSFVLLSVSSATGLTLVLRKIHGKSPFDRYPHMYIDHPYINPRLDDNHSGDRDAGVHAHDRQRGRSNGGPVGRGGAKSAAFDFRLFVSIVFITHRRQVR